jgi:hypothetical protein
MRYILSLLLVAAPSMAAPILTVPNNGIFDAPVSSTLSLPFSITPDATRYVVIQSVQGTVTRGPAEIYAVTDVLSNYVALNSYALGPQSPVVEPWTQTVTPQFAGAGAGAIGTVFVPLNATLGQAIGTILVAFELFDLDPFVDPLAVSLGTGTMEASFVVNFLPANEVPEPGTVLVVGVGVVMVGWRWRRRRIA